MNKQYTVKIAHQASEASPLFVNKNEDLWIGERDGRPGWTYCMTKMSGKTGLVPEQIISRASGNSKSGTLTEDYSARELSVKPGDKVESNRELNGWAWCIDEDGNAGWLPLEKLH